MTQTQIQIKRRKGFRFITVNETLFQWKVGKHIAIAVREDGQQFKINLTDLMNMPWHILDREMWKGNLRITPKNIAEWLVQI